MKDPKSSMLPVKDTSIVLLLKLLLRGCGYDPLIRILSLDRNMYGVLCG